MPKVPVYGEPQVKQQALPNVRLTQQSVDGATPDAFGAGAGRAAEMLSKAADSVGKELERQQEITDASTVFESKNKFRLGMQKIEAEVSKRQGTKAVGAREWAAAEIKKLQEEIGGSLENDRQRRLFTQESESIGISALGAFGEYETNQIEKGHDENWRATKNLAIDDAMRNPSPENMARVEAEIQRANQYQAARRGWDDTVLAAETLSDMSKMHTGILRKIMAGGDQNLGAAQAYLKAHKDKIDPVVAADVQDRITVKSQQAASSSYAKQLEAQGLSQGEAIMKAREDYGYGKDGDQRVSDIRQMYAEKELVKTEKINQALEKINIEINNVGLYKLSDDAIEPLKTLDPARYYDVRNKREHARANTSEKGDPFGDSTNLDEYDMLKEMIENGDIQNARSLDLYVPSLTKSDHRTLVKMIDNQDKVDTKSVKSEYMSIVGSSKLTPDQRAELNFVQSQYVDWITKDGNPKDLRKFIADKMANYRTGQQWPITTWWSGPVKPEYDPLMDDSIEAERIRASGGIVTDNEDINALSLHARNHIDTKMTDDEKKELGPYGSGADAALLYKEARQGLIESKKAPSDKNITWAMINIVRDRKANANKSVSNDLPTTGLPGMPGYGLFPIGGAGDGR